MKLMHAFADQLSCNNNVLCIKTNVVKGLILYYSIIYNTFFSFFSFQEKPFVDVEEINIQIESSKTYFSDRYVETTEGDEMDLVQVKSKINTDEPVSIIIILLIFFIYTSCFVFIDQLVFMVS